MHSQFAASLAAASFKTSHVFENAGGGQNACPTVACWRRHLLVVSAFDQALSRNDCGEQVARSVGLDADTFYAEAAELGATTPLIERGGEFAALALVHPRFAGLTRQDLVRAAAEVQLKDNVGEMYAAMQAGGDDWFASVYIVSAGPQETVRQALRAQGVPPDHVFGSRFSFFEKSDKVSGLLHVSAGEGKADIIKDLQTLLGIHGRDLVYLGSSGSDAAAMRYIQSQGGLCIAVEDNAILHPYRSCLIPKSDDVLDFLPPVIAYVDSAVDAHSPRKESLARGASV